jgi:hypothetical protein
LLGLIANDLKDMIDRGKGSPQRLLHREVKYSGALLAPPNAKAGEEKTASYRIFHPATIFVYLFHDSHARISPISVQQSECCGPPAAEPLR